MSTEVRWRRGTTAEHDNFIGAEAEVTVDTERKELRIHDGVTPGGAAQLTEGRLGTGADEIPLNADLGSASTLDTGTAADEIPTNADLGSASTLDTGTAAGEVPTNADLGSASTLDTGTAAGEVPTNADLPNSSSVGAAGGEIPTNADFRVDSIADLLALNTTNARHVYLHGFYSVGDGGGGYLYWDSSENTSNHNGGTIIDPNHSASPGSPAWFTSESSTTGCWVRKDDVIRVEQFGAVPDGESGTDRGVAVQQAISACPNGGIVQFGRGDFRIDQTLDVNKTVEIRGTGAGGMWVLDAVTRLYFRNGTHGFTFSANRGYYELKDFHMLGSQAKSDLSELNFSAHDFGNCALRMTEGHPVWSYNLRLEGWDCAWVKFRNDANGDSWGGAYTYTDSVYTRDCHYGFVMYDFVTDGRFNNCEARECTGGLWLEGHTGYHTSHWTNCMFEKLGNDYSATGTYDEAGIWVGNTALARFYGCYAEDTSFYAGTRGQIEFGGFIKSTCDAAGHGILDFTGCTSHWTRLDEVTMPPVHYSNYWTQFDCSVANYPAAMNNGGSGVRFDINSSGARINISDLSDDDWSGRIARTLPSYDQVERYAYQVQIEYQVDSSSSTAVVPVVDFGGDYGNIPTSVILSQHEASGGAINNCTLLVFIRSGSGYQEDTPTSIKPRIWLDWNGTLSSGDAVTIRRFRADLLCLKG